MLTMQQASSPRLLHSPVSSPKFLAHDHPIKLVGASSSSSSTATFVASSSAARSSGGSSLLKRKRPAKLCIPVLDNSLRALDTDKNNSHPSLSSQTQVGESYAVFSKRGRRRVMEDTFTAVTNIRGKPNQLRAFFGVFDGHGGREASEFVASNIMQNILGCCSNDGTPPGDEEVRLGYHKTDSDFVRLGSSSGTCCLTALITDTHVLVANAGDCRAVVVKSGGVAVQLTHDHRVSCSAERQRIESLGGVVDCYTGTWRVQGVLAVSRGIGDVDLKPFVTCEPDMTRFEITNDCHLLVLASDGLWDVVSNQEVVKCALGALERESSGVSSVTCQELVNLAMKRGCLDDITVLVVDLRMIQTL